MSRVADPFLAQAEALLAVEDDPFLSQAEALLAEDAATPNVASATRGVALPSVPSNISSPLGAMSYMGGVVNAVSPTQANPPADTWAGRYFAGYANTLADFPSDLVRAGQAAVDFIQTPSNEANAPTVDLRGTMNSLASIVDQGTAMTKQAAGVPGVRPGGIPEAIGSGAANLGTQVLLGAATGGSSLPMQAAGFAVGGAAPVLGQTMRDASNELGAGQEGKAANEAVAAAGVTAVTSFFPGMAILRRVPGGDKAAAKLLAWGERTAVRRLAGAGLAEGGQEFVEGAIQDILTENQRRGKPVTRDMVVAALTDPQRAMDFALGAGLGGVARVPFEVGGQNAGNQNNPVGQNQNVPGAGGSLPIDPNGVAAGNTVERTDNAPQPTTTQAVTALDPAPQTDPELMTEEELGAALAGLEGSADQTPQNPTNQDTSLASMNAAANPALQTAVPSEPTSQNPAVESTAWFIPPEQRRRMEQVRQTQSATNTNDSATLRPSEPSTSPESLGIGNDQPTTLTEPTSSPVAQEDDATKNPELSNQDTSNPPQDVAQGVASTSNPIPDDVARYIRGMDNVELMLVRDSVKSGKPPTNEDYRQIVEELSPYIETVLSELSRRYDASPTNLTPQGVASVRGLGKSDPTLQEGEGKPPPQMNVPEIRRVPGEPVLGGEPRTRFQEGVADALPAAAATGANQTTFSRSQSSPNSTPDLAELSKRSGAAVTLADSAKLTETERSVTKRLGSLGRSVVWVDTAGPARGAVVGRTPTTIYLRRGMGNVRLAPIALHEVMHSARRTNRELADELVSVFGRDKVLARGREELGLQAEAGVDVAGSEDAAIDEGLAGLLEDAANENADLRQRIIETPGLLDRLRVWLKQTLANLAGKGSQEVRHAMRLLDQLEAQARKESNSRAEKSIDWARSQSGVKRKIDDAYNSGSAAEMQRVGDSLTEAADPNNDAAAFEGDVQNFPGPIPREILDELGPDAALRYGLRANVKGGRAPDSYYQMGPDRFRMALEAKREGKSRGARSDALRKAQEPEARFVAAYSDLLGGKPPTKPKQAARVSELQGGDIIRIEGQASRVIEDENGKSLMGGAFDGLSVDGIEAIPVDVGARGWWRVDSGTAEPADAPKEQAADIPFSARSAKTSTVFAGNKEHLVVDSPSGRDLRAMWRTLPEYQNAPRGAKMVRYVLNKSTDQLIVHDGNLLHDDFLRARPDVKQGWFGSGWLYADGSIHDYNDENDVLIRKGVGPRSDIRFSARKLELRSEQQQGMLNFTSGWAAPKQSKEPPLSAKEKAELYPGIRQGETVSQYNKRMGTSDTPVMFSAKLPDTIEVDGKQRPTTNSDGKPIARTAEEVRNFWRWFADSKVVDADGKPLVVYHGTKAGDDFTVFDAGRSGQNYAKVKSSGQAASNVDAPRGIYFHSDDRFASKYATGTVDPSKSTQDKARIVPAIVSVTNPLVYTTDMISADIFLDSQNARIQNDLKQGNFDGIIVRRKKNDPEWDHTVVVAFSPSQIKSATGNRGTFDAGNADIRFSAGKQSNFAKEDARDTKTITKLSRQATEATQNLEAEKAKGRAIESANKMRANMEVRIAKVAKREAARLKDRTAQVIEKKAAEAVTLSQKREAERQAAKQTIADLKNSARSLLGLLAKGDKAYNASQAKLSDADAKNWITGQKAKWTAEATDQLRKAVHTLIRKDSESAKTILSKLTQAKTPGEIYNLAREVERYAAFDDARRLQRRLVGFLGVGDITRLGDAKVRDKIVTKGALEVLSGLDGQRDEAKYAMSTIIDLGAEFDRLYRAGEPAAGLRQTLDEMNAMFSRLVQLKHEAKLADKIVKNGRLSNVYDTVKVDEPAIKAAPTRLVGKFGRHARSLKPWLTRQVLNVPTLVRVVTGGKGAIHQTITEGLAKGTSDAFNIKRKAFAEADAAAKAAGYVDLRDALAKISGSLGEASQKTITLSTPLNGTTEISLDQAMKIAAIDPETLDDMLTRDRRFNWSTNLGGNGDTLTWDTYSEIRDKVGPEHLKLIDTLKDIRDDRFEPMARVVKALTGVEPPKVIGYEPRRVNQEYLKAKRGAEPNANMNATTFTNSMLQNMGLTKARESKAAPLVMHGFLQDWVASIDEVSRITAMAETVHNAHTMLRVESVKNAIDERWGTEVLNDIHRRIDTVAGVEATDQRMKKVTRVVKFLSRNVGRSLTAVNVKSWLRTTGGVFPLAAEMPRAWFVRGVKDAFTTKGLWDEALANSPILDEQFGQSPVGLAGAGEAMTGLQPKATAQSVGRSAAALGKSVKSAAVNAANFRVDTFADIRDIFDKGLPNLMDHIRVLNFFASLPARIAYAGNKARYGGDIQRAVRETERVIRETQGMNDPLYRSGWQHTIMGGPLAPLAMFSNDGSRMLNQLVNAKLDGKPGKVIAAILLNSAWGGLIVAGLSKAMINALLNDDDDEANTEQALRDGAFTAVRDTAGLVPGADRLVETVWAAVDKGRRGAPSDAALSTPVGSLLSDTVDATTKLFGDGVTALGDDAKAQRAEDRFWKNLESLGLNASSVAGVPLAPGYRLVKNVAGAAAK